MSVGASNACWRSAEPQGTRLRACEPNTSTPPFFRPQILMKKPKSYRNNPLTNQDSELDVHGYFKQTLWHMALRLGARHAKL